MQNDTKVVMLNTNLIIPNKYQPRKVFEDASIDSLAKSIKTYGIINPILVRKKDDKYEIIAGERRFRAAIKIGLTEIPAIIKDTNEQEMAELALIENIQRQELTPIEEAKSYEEIMRLGNQTQQSLAEKLGKSQSFIANKIRLLSLPQEIQDAVTNRKISERHARCLISVEEKDRQLELLNKIITEKLTVKETERIINENQINEEEIKQAISDIMKSLNIKEEEKEDDNMNNGNFFPNFNNNTTNNNTSLNMMNMQSMNQPPIEAVPEMVMPSINQPVQEQVVKPIIEQPIMPNNQETVNQTNNPFSNNIISNNNLDQNNSFTYTQELMPQQENNISPQMTNNADSSLINNEPLFSIQQPAEPAITPLSQTTMVDEPLFNPNIIMPGSNGAISPASETQIISQIQPVEPPIPVIEQPVVEKSPFEVPVTNQNAVETNTHTDKLTELQNLLSANGYTYKHYSNDTDNCIIIELPKN